MSKTTAVALWIGRGSTATLLIRRVLDLYVTRIPSSTAPTSLTRRRKRRKGDAVRFAMVVNQPACSCIRSEVEGEQDVFIASVGLFSGEHCWSFLVCLAQKYTEIPLSWNLQIEASAAGQKGLEACKLG